MKAIALYSGGLDSTLAVLVMRRLGCEVIAVNFTTQFGCSPEDKSSCSHASDSIADQYGFTLKYFPLGELFNDIVKKPAHGYGKNMNPCIDCRILMLREAKKLMDKAKADFIITGEVLGQRPMSQHIGSLKLVEKESGVEGYLVRPLSAQLLMKTIPEEKGIINREQLYSFSGRGRKNQLALAKEFKLEKIPQPASGCLLTDPMYSKKLRDLLEHNTSSGNADIELLKTGRHFRLSPAVKLIVGRNEKENLLLEKITRGDSVFLYPGDSNPGPSALIIGPGISRENIDISSGICAGFSDGRNRDTIVLLRKDSNGVTELKVKPIGKEISLKYLI